MGVDAYDRHIVEEIEGKRHDAFPTHTNRTAAQAKHEGAKRKLANFN